MEMDINRNRRTSSVLCKMAFLRHSDNALLVSIALTMLLDYVLLTAIVTIMPEYLYNIDHPTEPLRKTPTDRVNVTADSSKSNSSTTFYQNTTDNEDSSSQNNITGETTSLGILLATNPLLQMIANPFVGPLTHRIGYSIPMFVGLFIISAATLIYAFGRNYLILLLARGLQGIGTSFASIAALGLLAERFTDESGRGTAMGLAFSGISLGILLGPPLGGLMYQFLGYFLTFLILCGLLICNTVFSLAVLPLEVTPSTKPAPSLKKLLSDPYIMIAAGMVTIGNLGVAVLEPSLPLQMIKTTGATPWQQGAIFIPASLAYFVSAGVFGPLGHLIGRWLVAFIGLIFLSAVLIAIPFGTNLAVLLALTACMGLAVGMVENSMIPELAHLVEIRHTAVYGTVYAIGNFALSLGYILGPVLIAALVDNIGFQYTMISIALLGLFSSPLLFFLKSPPKKEETKSLIVEDQRLILKYNEEMDPIENRENKLLHNME